MNLELDVIIKSIIFAICFPVGMSLIYGLRKKLKGSKVIPNSNFVKIPRKKYILFGIINILLFPLGVMGFLGGIYELSLLFSSISKVDWVILILTISLIAVDSYYLHLLFSFRNKVEIIDSETIRIFKGGKSCQFHKKNISYKCAENIIRLYDVNGKRIASITHLYENTQILIKWLEQSDEVVKNVNNVFYEYDTDKSEECK